MSPPQAATTGQVPASAPLAPDTAPPQVKHTEANIKVSAFLDMRGDYASAGPVR
jgi:hypothetical protein